MTENYTLFVNTDYIKDIETLDEYLVLAQKPCFYANGNYSVIVFTILDETAEAYDPETILEVMGGLALHEDGSNCFLVMENDIEELADIFCWDSAAHILMGEMLTPDDKRVLLEKKQKQSNFNGEIMINLGSKEEPKWESLDKNNTAVFTDESTVYKLGDNALSTDIWWPFLIEENGGFNIVVQKKPDDEPEQTQYPLVKTHPNPWDPEDDDFFNDYDYPDWMHMHHGGRYQF